MARMTLLEMVQDILSDMDSDAVTSYTDTVESVQVAQILKTTYFNIIDGRDWPHLYQFFRLTETDANTPTHMTLVNDVMNVDWIKYNVRNATDTKDRYHKIEWKSPEEFMMILDSRDSSATNIDVITSNNIFFNVYNDRAPSYFTTFDEDLIVFDAFDSGVETFLKTAKNQCYGKVYPTVTLADGMYFDLPTEGFSYLLNESKSVVFLALKQVANPKAEQHSVTQRRRMSQEAWRFNKGIIYPDYGRKGKRHGQR